MRLIASRGAAVALRVYAFPFLALVVMPPLVFRFGMEPAFAVIAALTVLNGAYMWMVGWKLRRSIIHDIEGVRQEHLSQGQPPTGRTGSTPTHAPNPVQRWNPAPIAPTLFNPAGATGIGLTWAAVSILFAPRNDAVSAKWAAPLAFACVLAAGTCFVIAATTTRRTWRRANAAIANNHCIRCGHALRREATSAATESRCPQCGYEFPLIPGTRAA
jgi:hypothetical protein